MLATSPSPNLESGITRFSRSQYDQSPKPFNPTRTALKQNEQSRKHRVSPDQTSRNPTTRSLDLCSPQTGPPKMVDKGTQWSPPDQKVPTPPGTKTPTSTIAGLQLSEKEDSIRGAGVAAPAPEKAGPTYSVNVDNNLRSEPAGQAQGKRPAIDPPAEVSSDTNNAELEGQQSLLQSPVKKARPDAPPVRLMPRKYEDCNTRDLVILIASMLVELIRYNDAIPLREGQLTRFHSRAPPGISVLDYLQRLTTHATLSPPILLSVVFYIDRLCALYPAFTISSLTVHRFLITSATVASKGLSDSFWTNKTYARVGGVSMKELALLELEFLQRMEWRIVPKPEVLCDYYKSLIQRNSQYQLED